MKPNMEQIGDIRAIAEEHGGRIIYLKHPEGGQQIYLGVLRVLTTPEEVEASLFVFSDPDGREIARFMVMDYDLEWLMMNRQEETTE